MDFTFNISKIFQFENSSLIRIIGILEDGEILAPIEANILEKEDCSVFIESVALTGAKSLTGQKNEITLIAKKPDIAPQSLEGCHLAG